MIFICYFFISTPLLSSYSVLFFIILNHNIKLTSHCFNNVAKFVFFIFIYDIPPSTLVD